MVQVKIKDIEAKFIKGKKAFILCSHQTANKKCSHV